MRFLVLGGYGNTGAPIVRSLLRHTQAEVVVVGRDSDRARRSAERANAELALQRAQFRGVDAADAADLRDALHGIDLVVVASSTARHMETVARAAIETGADYMDLWYSPAKAALMESLAPRIEAAGRTFLTQGGLHPGAPAALVRRAALWFTRLERARVASFIRADWASMSFSRETLDEFEEPIRHLYYENGVWRDAADDPDGDLAVVEIDGWEGEPFVPVYLAEMGGLPELIPSLLGTGFYLHAEHGRPAEPPWFARMRIDAFGVRGDTDASLRLTLEHEDGYELTALSVAAAVRQYLDGSLRRPGVLPVALSVDPDRYLEDLESMGVTVEIDWRQKIR